MGSCLLNHLMMRWLLFALPNMQVVFCILILHIAYSILKNMHFADGTRKKRLYCSSICDDYYRPLVVKEPGATPNSEPVSNLWWFNFPEMVTHSDTDLERKCSSVGVWAASVKWPMECCDQWPAPGVPGVLSWPWPETVRWLHCQTHIWETL